MGDAARRLVLTEAPHTSFSRKTLPPELAFLGGSMVDLGFEDLGLDETTFEQINLHFASVGVRVPGTNYKLRWQGGIRSTVEPLTAEDADLPVLPEYWEEAVLVLGEGDNLLWVGKRVREKRLEGFTYDGFVDFGPAWVPPQP